MVNVVLIDVFILPPDYGPTIPACVILITLLLLLLRDAPALLQVTWTSQQTEPPATRRLHFWVRTAIVAVMMVFGTMFMRR